MSIITTKRNRVAAIEPLPTDIAVFSRVGTARVIRPIHKYNEAVSEAVKLADLMEAHVDVVPIDFDELLSLCHMTRESFSEIQLEPAELEELREIWLCQPNCVTEFHHSATSGTRSSPNISWKLCNAGFQ